MYKAVRLHAEVLLGKFKPDRQFPLQDGLTGGYGSAIGASFGALIFGTVEQGIFYTGVNTDWFKVFLGGMLLIAVMFNTYIRRKATGGR